MVRFVAENWWWILLAGGMVFMHSRGHTGHGGGGCCGPDEAHGASDHSSGTRGDVSASTPQKLHADHAPGGSSWNRRS